MQKMSFHRKITQSSLR